MQDGIAKRFEQPISAPGGRLLRQIGLRFVQRRAGAARARSSGFELPLVPLVDCLLALVLFLLSSFHASGECCIEHRIDVPRAANALAMLEAPVVAVTTRQILVDGLPAGRTEEVAQGERVQRIDELFNIMKNKRELWKQINPGQEFPGTALMHVDRSVSAIVVKSVFQSTAFAGFPHIAFIVKRYGADPLERGRTL